MLQRCLRTSVRRSTIHRYPSVNHATQWLRYKSATQQKPDPARKLSNSRVVATSYLRRLWNAYISWGFLGYGLTILLGGHIFMTYVLDWRPCDGISMLPTFQAAEDAALVSKYYRRGRGIQVGDVVTYRNPVNSDETGLKRVLGMEGDFVLRDTPKVDEDGMPVDDGEAKMIQIPKGHCWVVGDNLPHSRDSRLFGPLPMALIKGKVIRQFSPWYRVWAPITPAGLQELDYDDEVD